MATLLTYKVKYCGLSLWLHCSLLSLPQLEPELESKPLNPVEIQGLELATGYEVSGRCRMEEEEDLWGEWSPILSFQTLPSGKDLLIYPCTFIPLLEVCLVMPLICVLFLMLASSKRCMDIREPLWDPRWTEIPASVEGELWIPVMFLCTCQETPK